MQRMNKNKEGSSWLCLADERKKFLSALRIRTKLAQHATRQRFAIDFLDTSHHHAHVTGFDYHTHTAWTHCLVYRVGYFPSKSLLYYDRVAI